jgi:hypothetical protein
VEIPFMVVCDHAHKHRGLLTCAGIRKRIMVPELPWTHPSLFVAWETTLDHAEFLDGLTSEFEFQLTIQDEDGKKILELRRKTRMQGSVRAGQKGSQFEVLGLAGLVFRRPCTHTFVIRVNGQVKAEEAIDVMLSEPKRGTRGEGEGDG